MRSAAVRGRGCLVHGAGPGGEELEGVVGGSAWLRAVRRDPQAAVGGEIQGFEGEGEVAGPTRLGRQPASSRPARSAEQVEVFVQEVLERARGVPGQVLDTGGDPLVLAGQNGPFTGDEQLRRVRRTPASASRARSSRSVVVTKVTSSPSSPDRTRMASGQLNSRGPLRS